MTRITPADLEPLLTQMPADLARLLGYSGPSEYIGLWCAGSDLVIGDGTFQTTSVNFKVWQLFERHPMLRDLFHEIRFKGDEFSPPDEMLIIRVRDGALFVAPFWPGIRMLTELSPPPKVEVPGHFSSMDEMADAIRSVTEQIAQERLAPVTEAQYDEVCQWIRDNEKIWLAEITNPQRSYC